MVHRWCLMTAGGRRADPARRLRHRRRTARGADHEPGTCQGLRRATRRSLTTGRLIVAGGAIHDSRHSSAVAPGVIGPTSGRVRWKRRLELRQRRVAQVENAIKALRGHGLGPHVLGRLRRQLLLPRSWPSLAFDGLSKDTPSYAGAPGLHEERARGVQRRSRPSDHRGTSASSDLHSTPCVDTTTHHRITH